MNDHEQAANARLIAAAPEMHKHLAALAAWAEDLAYEMGDQIGSVIGEQNRIDLATVADEARALLQRIEGQGRVNEWQANARLIAAAPALLGALTALVTAVARENGERIHVRMAEARAAIRLAEGGE